MIEKTEKIIVDSLDVKTAQDRFIKLIKGIIIFAIFSYMVFLIMGWWGYLIVIVATIGLIYYKLRNAKINTIWDILDILV